MSNKLFTHIHKVKYYEYMADLIKKRLQVFVSSTYVDLRKERQAVIEAILTAGHIPAGMELFTAGDESQMNTIKQWIDQSDVYMLLLGGRYGSVEEISGKSYTHLEYDYAIEQGKPLFAIVISDEAIDRKVAADGKDVIERDNTASYNNFKEQVLSSMSSFWDDEKDIKLETLNSLSTLSRRDGLVGWVRGDEAFDPNVANEVARLSRENAELRELVKKRGGNYAGMGFDELVTHLENHNSLEFFLGISREILYSNFVVSTKPSDRRIRIMFGFLADVGIVELQDLFEEGFRVKSTEEGKKFITRLILDTT